MLAFKQKGLLVTIISLFLISALGVVNSIAEDKIKHKDTRYQVATKVEMMKVEP
jgi:hypothetical protein